VIPSLDERPQVRRFPNAKENADSQSKDGSSENYDSHEVSWHSVSANPTSSDILVE
jgi:hypothetical protein